jgi:phage terminase large subunit
VTGTDKTEDGYIPLRLFPRQREMVEFLEARAAGKEDGLIEKSRDIGFTWVSGGWALHKWLFSPGFKVAFGSRTEDMVDKLGDPDSIFEKIRVMLRFMPRWLRPANFYFGAHCLHLRIINPQNGNIIRGEGGKNMGRGGRSTVYILDEFAFLDNGADVERATSGNTDTRIFASTVNTPVDMFARKRFGGALKPHQIFRFHYTDDPRKTQDWVAHKKSSMEPHAWASEYEIDYSAAVEGLCIPAKWVSASLEIAAALDREGLKIEPKTRGVVGGDVGGGKAKSVAIARFGPLVMPPMAWGDPDTTETAHRMVDYAKSQKLVNRHGEITVGTLNFDPIGIGAGVLSALRFVDGLVSQPTNVGNPPSSRIWPDGEDSKSKFANLKAELWFLARTRFKQTYEMLQWLKGESDGHEHPLEELIVLPPLTTSQDAMILAGQLSLVKWFRNETGKVIIESKQSLSARQVASPDHAEAFMLTFMDPPFNMDNIS